VTRDRAKTETPPRRLGRSAGAILAGIAAVVLLSTVSDMIMHATGIFPPVSVVMRDAGLFALALAYRGAFGIAGSWLAARLSPSRPMAHAMTVGVVGFVLSVVGVVVTWNMDMGPRWYPLALVVITLPCAWIGGIFARTGRRR
jgi:putative exporter of polyketide antibiotics